MDRVARDRLRWRCRRGLFELDIAPGRFLEQLPNTMSEKELAALVELLQVGYAACHWCHVMAHESFENPEFARLMNERFINIKVDRQERPDVEHIYQQVVQMMDQGGGQAAGPLTARASKIPSIFNLEEKRNG